VSRRERGVEGGLECVGRKWWMEEKAKDVTFEQDRCQNIKALVRRKACPAPEAGTQRA